MQAATIEGSLKEHVNRRVEHLYPDAEYGKDGAVLPEILAIVREQGEREVRQDTESMFDLKQTAMPERPASESLLFEDMRPSIVTDEGCTADTLHDDVVAEHALKSVSGLTIKMSNKFENQYVSSYMPRIFPWALNYDCGGAEYPDLFTDWEELLRRGQECAAQSIQQRWRRLHDEVPLQSGEHAAMLATRVETQVAGDWMLVPAARNLHWRWAVLRSAFVTCKQKVSPGETLDQNLTELIGATKRIWERMAKNAVQIQGVKKNINGNVSMLFAADDITSAEKIVLRSYLNTTASIAGCQQIRKKIGASCFGFRVVHGECIFVTVSPSRRHSSMVLKLSRARRNDVGLTGQGATSESRRRCASATQPSIFCSTDLTVDPDGREVEFEVPLPPMCVRQGWNAQDPLASVHHYLVFMYVVLPAAFGLRMCFNCPDCNADSDDPGAGSSLFECSACADNMVLTAN
jgi:hypothetical protein